MAKQKILVETDMLTELAVKYKSLAEDYKTCCEKLEGQLKEYDTCWKGSFSEDFDDEIKKLNKEKTKVYQNCVDLAAFLDDAVKKYEQLDKGLIPKDSVDEKDYPPGVEINDNYSIPNQQWLEITPHKTNAEGHRSADAYNEVLADLDVANRKRYTPSNGSTWCNIYVWDATKAMGCEIPHYYDPKTGAALTREYCLKNPGSYYEMSATRMTSWLANYGAKNGWIECDEATAIAMANKGMPTVAAATTTNHVAMVTPQRAGETGVMISQAGARNFEHGSIKNGFGNYPVKYYYHA